LFADAYPHHYTISYCSAIEELRRCCIRCSGDSTLFANVLLLMNEMQSISPEAIHCLFSVDKLSALFS
uniref:CCR4-NOT transcription complex subunit 11 n=1 Tax=Schistocephalus solidus TaxID=70667 RepID=A0A183TQ90_SCHSO